MRTVDLSRVCSSSRCRVPTGLGNLHMRREGMERVAVTGATPPALALPVAVCAVAACRCICGGLRQRLLHAQCKEQLVI